MQEEDPTAVDPDEEAEPKGKARGHDPDKTTGQERAEEVRSEQAGPDEEDDDPTSEDDAPDIPDMPGEEGDEYTDEELENMEEEVPEDEFDDEAAAADDTVDNSEQLEEPLTRDQLPEGAHRDDYGDDAGDVLKEHQDGEEETPERR
jgi:hypothetical protein